MEDIGNWLLLETIAVGILLEDASGVLLLESSPAPIAINGYLAVLVGDGMSVSEKIR